MTIQEAIELLSSIYGHVDMEVATKERIALKLGIEALKRVKLHRTDRRYPFNTLLPGETEE